MTENRVAIIGHLEEKIATFEREMTQRTEEEGPQEPTRLNSRAAM